MTVNKEPEKIKNMFNCLAKSYDRNNNIISLGTHYLVKKLALNKLSVKNEDKILDICCGTGDIEKILLDKYDNINVTGLDFAGQMLDIAKERVKRAEFVNADATQLPFESNLFDKITMTFGLRNIVNRNAAIAESYRVLKSGGELLHLDFGVKNIFTKIFDFIATAGIKIFYGEILPYKYLINSKKEFPEPDELIKEFEKECFKLSKRVDYLFGIISAQIFTK